MGHHLVQVRLAVFHADEDGVVDGRALVVEDVQVGVHGVLVEEIADLDKGLAKEVVAVGGAGQPELVPLALGDQEPVAAAIVLHALADGRDGEARGGDGRTLVE